MLFRSPTPNVPLGGRSLSIEQTMSMKSKSGRKVQVGLENVARLAHWTTPNTNEQNERPEVKDARNARHCAAGKMKGVGSYKLSTQALLTTWATPNATDSKHAGFRSYAERGGGSKGMRLNDQVVHSGPMSNGSLAETEKRDQLNPLFSLWLQGYPEAWASCAEQAMPSSRKSRKPSSKRT